MSTLYLSPKTVPAGSELPTDVQALITLIAQYCGVAGNEGEVTLNYGSATPSADDRDKPWFKVSPSGAPIGLFSWNGTEWKQTPLTALSGDTSSRPTNPTSGLQYFDTSINVMLIFERAKWRTLSGSPGDVKYVAKPTLAEALTANPGWSEYKNGRGRVIGGAGAGSGLTERTYEEMVGAETHAITVAELPSLTFEMTLAKANADGNDYGIDEGLLGHRTPGAAGSKTITSDTKGENDPHNNMQPTVFLWCLVKE